MDATVLVVGSGPTGLAMAIELRRLGLQVRIIDKSDHLARHSQALVVQARTLEQFQRYGIAQKAVSSGRRVSRAVFFSDGKEILSFSFGRIPSRYPFVLFLPQSHTEAILNDHMESLNVRTERGVELLSIAQHDPGASATLRHPDGREEHLAARWIIGCDGAHSSVRNLSGISFEGAGVGLSFFLGDVELDGPDAPTDELSLHLRSGNVVFLARLSDKLTRVIVALHSEQGQVERRDISLQDLKDAVDVAGVRVNIHSAEWLTPFNVSDRQAKHYRSGNVFLAGDASHIHSPVGGQGMNTGLQDAANLAWKLAAVARGAADSLLDTYEEERGKVGKALLRFTERGLKMATASNPLIETARDLLLPHISRSTTVQDAAIGFISETAIEYRPSSAVADHGGDGALRAGDRMPDFGLRAGSSPTLFGKWHDAEHLAVLVNSTDSAREALARRLLRTQTMSIDRSQLDDEGRRLLGTQEKIFVVRPDGYIGFRAPLSKAAELDAYARQDALLLQAAAHRT